MKHLLEGVKERLGVIQGVLLMIEQYGAAMLTEEMVALADFISGNKQEQGERALEVMLRAVLQLPDYLEHIQSGHRDIPIAILPLLNDIRAVMKPRFIFREVAVSPGFIDAPGRCQMFSLSIRTVTRRPNYWPKNYVRYTNWRWLT